jgi:hypothetical protein
MSCSASSTNRRSSAAVQGFQWFFARMSVRLGIERRCSRQRALLLYVSDTSIDLHRLQEADQRSAMTNAECRNVRGATEFPGGLRWSMRLVERAEVEHDRRAVFD